MELRNLNRSQTSVGYLIVEATAAEGALPIEGAVVSVTAPPPSESISISVETDRSGRTERLSLPTRAGYYSMTPDEKYPYSTYTVHVYATGYYPFVATNVPIFAGVTSLQSAPLIALAAYDSENVYPNGNTSFNEDVSASDPS